MLMRPIFTSCDFVCLAKGLLGVAVIEDAEIVIVYFDAIRVCPHLKLFVFSFDAYWS